VTEHTGSPGAEPQWRGTSAAERLRQRRSRLVDAAYRLLAGGDDSALTIRAVCRAANVSPRHFYEVFADTDALLRATYDHAIELLVAAVRASLADSQVAPMPIRGRLEALFSAAAEHFENDPAAARIIFTIALSHDALRDHGITTLLTFVAGVRASLGPGSVPGPAVSSAPDDELRTTMLAGGLAAVFSSWIAGGYARPRDEIVAYCTQAGLQLLGWDDSQR
jgi:AcrR family transcriptional regulator